MFEARYHRFSTIRSMSFLSERLYGPLQIKHAIYLMLAILFGWRGLSTGNANAIAFAVVVAFIGLLSAVAGTRTLSFEAKLFMVFYSLFDSLLSSEPKPRARERARSGSREKKVKETKRRLVLREFMPLLLIVVPPSSLAIYLAVTSQVPVAGKLLVIAASLLLVAIPVVLGVLR